mmetsp:Transcript_2397/g.5380  ORF Transcript_2397/g.5380 Transcript_2397/m.5380 type:complete len:195 (-) Transcript_2397:234-818(-)|eukprot:CAMPEP_0185856256 /NCGR_PEP_ID=MMETSP1354-20130828/28374_1 /TAXON_ID=708628 /ORGANISM="Erythrolobus madagascarensis, Strain CCMP3276" /LENGTH=194 /DNA_ID=CAMNT_0028558451 /DNA_START=153 /DNA_END=737 /DNA_ORIENTATION=+
MAYIATYARWEGPASHKLLKEHFLTLGLNFCSNSDGARGYCKDPIQELEMSGEFVGASSSELVTAFNTKCNQELGTLSSESESIWFASHSREARGSCDSNSTIKSVTFNPDVIIAMYPPLRIYDRGEEEDLLLNICGSERLRRHTDEKEGAFLERKASEMLRQSSLNLVTRTAFLIRTRVLRSMSPCKSQKSKY